MTTLTARMILQMEAAQAKAETASTTGEIKKLTGATGELGAKSKAAAGAADAEAAAKKRNAQASREMTTANRQAAAATGNLVANFNDIGMMLAAGQNPLQLAIQQGTQITQVIGPMGAAGAVKALGTAFTSMLSPINLVTLGVIAASGVMIQWLTGAEEGAQSLEDQIKAVTEAVSDWRGESGKSFADLRKEFGALTPDVIALQREINQLKIADILTAADTAARGLSDSLSGSILTLSSQSTNLEDLLGIQKFSRQGGAGNAMVLEFQSLLEGIGQASGVKEQLAVVEQLRARFAEVTGGVREMTAEQREFYGNVVAAEAALRAAAVATGDVAAGTEDAKAAAMALSREARALITTIASADGSKLVLAFSAAFPVASQLLGMAQGIIATIGGASAAMDAQDKLGQMAIEFSSGGQNLMQYGGRTPGGTTSQNGLASRNAPKAASGGSGGVAARDEANALQELIASLEAEIAALRVQDPIQQEMLKHREALAGATEAERQKVEELIAAREREQMLMEGAAARAQFFEDIGTQALDALIMKGESFNDVLKGIIASLIKAIAQAAIFGTGPFGSFFGGTSIIGALVPAKAEGGIVHGPGTGTSDSVPTLLSNGEFVVNAKSTARNRHLLEAINTGGRIAGFAQGGMVGADAQRLAERGPRDRPGMILIDLRGVQGDLAIEEKVRRGAAEVVGMYDREGLPVSIRRVSGDPRRRG